MVLVYFLLLILIIAITILIFSTLKINIEKLELSNEIDNTPIIKECDLCIGIYFLNKIRIFKKCTDKKDIEKISKSNNIQNFKNKILQNNTIKDKKTEVKERSKYYKKTIT